MHATPHHTSPAPPIIISGWGLVSPLGRGAWATFSSLLKGKTLADRAVNLPEDIDPIDLIQALGAVNTARHTPTDPAVELAESAAREALFMANAEPRDTPCITGISKGAMHALTAATQRYIRNQPPTQVGNRTTQPTDASLALALGPHSYLSHHLGKRLGRNPILNTVAACASSLTALHQARLALQQPHHPRKILVLTTEAALLPIFIHSYRRLGVLPPLRPSAYRGRPLDRHRCGFMLAEMAGAVVLETTDQIKPGQIQLLDTATACEAHDLIRTTPRMPALSRIAGQLLTNRRIDLLHPHATGTAHHDPTELAVLGSHLSSPTDVYACKGALGHGLGASGLVALVIACLCAQSGRRPPMPWLDQPLDTDQSRLSLRKTPHSGPTQTQAVFTAGFGGHVAGAVLAKR